MFLYTLPNVVFCVVRNKVTDQYIIKDCFVKLFVDKTYKNRYGKINLVS